MTSTSFFTCALPGKNARPVAASAGIVGPMIRVVDESSDATYPLSGIVWGRKESALAPNLSQRTTRRHDRRAPRSMPSNGGKPKPSVVDGNATHNADSSSARSSPSLIRPVNMTFGDTE